MVRTASVADHAARPLSARFAVVVVLAALAAAALVRASIVALAGDWARQQTARPEVPMILAAFALVIAYMVAVGGVGLGVRNRAGGGRLTLVFALALAALHVAAGLAWGMGILMLPASS